MYVVLSFTRLSVITVMQSVTMLRVIIATSVIKKCYHVLCRFIMERAVMSSVFMQSVMAPLVYSKATQLSKCLGKFFKVVVVLKSLSIIFSLIQA